MTHLNFSAPVKAVARPAGNVLRTVDHAINSRTGKTVLNVAGMVPGPIGENPSQCCPEHCDTQSLPPSLNPLQPPPFLIPLYQVASPTASRPSTSLPTSSTWQLARTPFLPLLTFCKLQRSSFSKLR